MDIDLDALAPADSFVTYRGIRYAIPGEIPLVTIIEASRLWDELTRLQAMPAGEIDPDEANETLNGLYRIIMELLRDRNENVPDLRLTPSEIGVLVAAIIAGSIETTNVDDAIRDALVGDQEGAPLPPTRTQRTASRSRRRSPAKSSR